MRVPFTHTGRKVILQTCVHHDLPRTGKNQFPLLDFFGLRSPGGRQEGQIATRAMVAPTCHHSPHSCTPSGLLVLRATTVPIQGPSSLLRVSRQNEGGWDDSTESLADAMREAQADTLAAEGSQESGSTTCPFSRMAAGYMALLGRSRCVGSSNIISRAWRYLSGREGEPVTK